MKGRLALILAGLIILFPFQISARENGQLTKAESAVKTLARDLESSILSNSPSGAVVAIVKFINLGPQAINRKMGEIVTALLTQEFAKSKRIKLVERENLDKLLSELKLSLLGVTNPKLASQVGKMLNAQYMIVGAVADVGNQFIINARVVNVATSRIVKAVKVRLMKDDVVALSSKYIVVKTKSGALFRSLLIPGWGQIYSGHVVKGAFFTTVTLGLMAGALVSHYLGYNVYYEKKYKNSTNTSDATYYYDKAVSTLKLRDRLLLAGAVVWVINAVDAYISGVNAKEVKSFEAVVSPQERGIYLGFRARFSF